MHYFTWKLELVSNVLWMIVGSCWLLCAILEYIPGSSNWTRVKDPKVNTWSIPSS